MGSIPVVLMGNFAGSLVTSFPKILKAVLQEDFKVVCVQFPGCFNGQLCGKR